MRILEERSLNWYRVAPSVTAETKYIINENNSLLFIREERVVHIFQSAEDKEFRAKFKYVWDKFRQHNGIEYDKLIIVDHLPRTITFEIEATDHVSSKDGISMLGHVAFDLKLCKNEKQLGALVQETTHQMNRFVKIVCSALRDTIAEIDWCDLVIVKGRNRLKETRELIQKYVLESLQKNALPFELPQLSDFSFRPINKKFAENIEVEKEQLWALKNKEERAKLEAQIKIEDDKAKLLAEKVKVQHELDLEKSKFEFKILQEKELSKAELEKLTAEKTAEIEILKSKAGMLKDNKDTWAIIDPLTYKIVEVEKLKLQSQTEGSKTKLLEQLLLKQTDLEHERTKGQMDMARAFITRQTGVDLNILSRGSNESAKSDAESKIKDLQEKIEQLSNNSQSENSDESKSI